MKRFILALVAVAALASTAHAQGLTIGEKVINFRNTGSSGMFPTSTVGIFYTDSSTTQRGGAAWGSTTASQTDTTVWFGMADLPGIDLNAFRGTSGAVGDSVYVFQLFFTPSENNGPLGLTAAADTIYVTWQGSNDGGQNIASATWTQLVSPTSANGFSRAMNSQWMTISNPSSFTQSNFLGYKQWRMIIASDINGQYKLSLRYPRRVPQ